MRKMGLGYTYSVGFKVHRDHPLADDVFESKGTEYPIRLHSVDLPDGDVLLTIFSGDSSWQFSEPIARQEYARKWDGKSPLVVYRQFYQSLDFNIPRHPSSSSNKPRSRNWWHYAAISPGILANINDKPSRDSWPRRTPTTTPSVWHRRPEGS